MPIPLPNPNIDDFNVMDNKTFSSAKIRKLLDEIIAVLPPEDENDDSES